MEINVKNGLKGNLMTVAIIGGILVATILIAGTYWSGHTASVDTETAVRNVSLLYLDELAERREQVVASKLDDYIDDMDVAIGMLEKSDLESIEALQAYQTRIKQLYNVDKFAFVDENGLIYTSRGTRTDIDQYALAYDSLSEPVISIKNPDSNNKKVIVAIPLDRLPFNDSHLVTCFMEIDMDVMLDGISLQSDNNNTTFCNMYTKDGTSLTNMVLGGLASEDNLLVAMETAIYEKGYSYDNIKDDFAKGNKGVVSFTYNNISETLYYAPIRGTDWMITYLIRESVISEQIGSISEGIVRRSFVQSVATAVVLIIIALVMINLIRQSAKLTLEKEVSETENRVKQQELEEQLALQEELLEQEKQRTQQDSMITAMASDYSSVYYVNLDTDEAICYRNDSDSGKLYNEGEHFDFQKAFGDYADKYVAEGYRDTFKAFIDKASIRRRLDAEPIIACRYLTVRDGVESYEMLRMAAVRRAEDRTDHIIHAVGVGFSDIDTEMRDSMAKNQALSDALATAEEASKAKTIFLSNMSHEIRTPMNAIIGLDNLALHEEGLSDNAKEYLKKIDSSAKHLLGLINDILDMSRIESGRMTLKEDEFSFSMFIEQVNTLINSQCMEKGLEFNCHKIGSIGEYYIGDSTKLKQVLINILSNAVKFTPQGGRIDFIVEKTGSFDGKSAMRFVIRDNGIGMSREYLPKIFDSFSQEDASAVNKYGSSGLGMAITKSIVEMMNGDISVESEKGVGTTFTVTVTLLESEKVSSGENADIEIDPEKMSVLVVDDDKIACEHAILVLKKAGITAEFAMSGEEAVDKIKEKHEGKNPYDLIIIDWRMPGMDGVETTKVIRSQIGDESAIIILTSYNWEDIFDDAVKAGVDSFISKPLLTDEVIDEFKNALKKRSSQSDDAKAPVDLSGKRVLLAEDVDINAQIMIKVLKMRGIETEYAENGRVAVDKYLSNPAGYYDAVLMDIRMPELNGLEASSAIRASGREDAQTIPIIALTANAFEEDVERSLQAGLNAHISKPVEPDILFKTLEDILE